MVEVFKTDVQHTSEANLLLALLRLQYGHYQANFDLTDCDKILRVQHPGGAVDADVVIALLAKYGHAAEVLPDEVPSLKLT